MTSRTSSVDIGTIQNDESLSDAELLERMHKIEEEHQALEREREREELRRDPDAKIKQYRYAIWHCHPRCGFKADRRDEGAIIEHKSLCQWCIQSREEIESEKQARRDGLASMRYILGMIEQAKDEIDTQTRRIKREEQEQQNNYELVIKMAEHKIVEAQNTIKREEIEKDKLLFNHPNEITRSAAQEMYTENYLNLSDRDRKRVHLYDQVL